MSKKTGYFNFLLLAFTLTICACSSSGKNDYQSLLDKPDKPFSSVNEALRSQDARVFPQNKGQVVKIRLSDPTYTDGSVINNFQVLETDLNQSGAYSMAVGSNCYECLGFRKKAMVPTIMVFDDNYNLVTDVKTSFSPLAFGFFGNGAIEVNNPGTHYIFIAADNESLTSPNAKSQTGIGIVPIPLPMPVSSTPEGNVSFKIKAPKK